MSNQANGSLSDTFIDVSHEYGHLSCFQGLPPLILKSNRHTYLANRDASDPLGTTWLSLAFAGLENLHLRTGLRVRNAAILGTGSGLDAVGISRIFGPEEIIASDIHPRALDAARWNIARFARPETRCEVLQSDLFRRYPNGSRFDLVFENLPNVPGDSDLLQGIRTASCYRAASYHSDPISDRHLLTLHYNCLLDARPHLRPDGWIVCMIGGRVPWEVIEEMFERTGFAATVFKFGLKTQTEAEIVIPGYARAEANGSAPFSYYYPIARCREILSRYLKDTSDSTAAPPPGVDPWGEDFTILNAKLEPCRISASAALSHHRNGEQVCHSVYVVGGTPASGPGVQG